MLAIGIADVGLRLETTPTVLAAIFIMCGVPTIYVLALMKIGVIQNFHVSDRGQRKYLFPVLIACFMLTVFVLWRDKAISRLIVAILAFGLPNIIFIALVSIWLKVSLHCAGLGGLLAASAWPFGWPGALTGLIMLLLTAWSRVRLREHTLPEVVAGAVIGTASMAFELTAVFGLPRF